MRVDVHDPYVTQDQIDGSLQMNHVFEPVAGTYDALVVAVAHTAFKERGVADIRKYGKEQHVLFDVKYVFSAEDSDGRL